MRIILLGSYVIREGLKAMKKHSTIDTTKAIKRIACGSVETAKEYTFAALEKCSQFIKLSECNKKLVPNKKVKFLIWNLPSRITCPFATALCMFFCYAKKAENGFRPSVLPSRKRNFAISKEDNFVERMIYTITAYCSKPSYQAAKKIVIRIHESGDFYSRDYVKAWLKIARCFEGNDKIVFMAYTKSVEYFDGLKIPKNMIVRFSLWSDTKPEQYAIAKRLNLPIYTAVDSFTNEKAINRCLCNDCGTCGKCWTSIDKLVCEIH